MTVGPQLLGLCNICRLSRLASSAQQQHDRISIQCAVEAIARAMVFSQFDHAVPYGFVIAPIAKADAVEPCADAGADGALTQIIEPARKRLVTRRSSIDDQGLRMRLAHGSENVVYELQFCQPDHKIGTFSFSSRL